MATKIIKYLSKSEKYKHVFVYTRNEETFFEAILTIKGDKLRVKCKIESEAARAIDLFLISKGKEPVNILKKKS